MDSNDPGSALAQRWVALFTESPRLTKEIFGAFDATGELADQAAYDHAVFEMGDTGHTSGVLVTWAGILACTHAATDDVLAPYIPTIGDDQWRIPAHRHGRALINTVRVATGAADGPRLVLDRTARIRDALGNDIWWLIWVMAAATCPVLRVLGGLDRLGEINDLVTSSITAGTPNAVLQHAVRAGPSVSAGLAAIDSGHLEHARTYFGLVQTGDLLTVLIPLIREVLHGTQVELVVHIDAGGVPHSIGEANSPAAVLTRDLINAVLSLDRARLAAARAAITAAGDAEQILMSWYLALTLGHHLP